MTHATAVSPNKTRLIGPAALLPVGLLVAVALLIAGPAISITMGAANIEVSTVYEALFRYDATLFDHLIIRTVRLPRVVAGVIIGAGLAVAGAIMQGLTANPLASPGILGVNAGAAFAVVVGVYLLGGAPFLVYGLLAIGGAAAAAVIVYTLASMGRGGVTPVKLTLAGVIFAMFTSAFTTAILVLDRNTFDQIRFWTVGSLAGRDWELILWMGPIVAVGLVGAMLLSRQITTISLGQDIAKGLGQNTAVIKAFAAVMVILLAGGSVAIAGPVGFVGLVIPHVVRAVCYWFGDTENAIFPWVQEALAGENPVVMNMPFGELNYEQILSFNPDLIIGVYSGITADEYALLAQIAPTLAQTAEAETLVANVDNAFAEARAAHPEFAGKSFVVAAVRADGTAYAFFSTQDPRTRFFTNLGFTPPTDLDELTDGSFYGEVSAERLDLFDRDLIIFTQASYLPDGADSILNDPLLGQLAAMKEGRYVILSEDLDAAFSFSTVLSLPYAVEELTPQLAAVIE